LHDLHIFFGTCNCDIWCDTAGILGRQVYFGTTSNDTLTFQTNNNPRMFIQNDGFIAIGNGQALYPLHVLNTVTLNLTGGYGYVNSSGNTGTGSSTGNTTFSARFAGRIIVGGEVNMVSDVRKKRDIEDLDLSLCKSFIKNIIPKKFRYDYEPDTNKKTYGYIAQDLLKNDFDELVNVITDDVDELIDEDKFLSPKDKSFILSNQNIIPILHNAIKYLFSQIDELKVQIAKYESVSVRPARIIEDLEYEFAIVNGKKLKIKKV
jgi:hypothetical protein